MKLTIASFALLIYGFVPASTTMAGAPVYCQYTGYPAGCIDRPVVVEQPTRDVRKPGGFILRQDLFARNNPNNLRSDWPSPPGLPGAAH
jgi:hypothetical protein